MFNISLFEHLMVPIVATVMSFGFLMLAVYLRYRRRKEMFELFHQERMAAIEKGIELPPLPEAFFVERDKPRAFHGHLLVGLILLFAGLGLGVALYFERDEDFLYGLIPVGIGLAFLVYYFAVGKKQAEAIEAAAKAKTTQPSRSSTP